MITHDIDALTTIGTKLQTAFTALDEAETLFADHDLESSFYDGMLTEKLATVTDQALALVEFVSELTKKAIEIRAEEDVTRVIDAALAHAEAVHSGEAFGLTRGDEGCADCPAGGTCGGDADGDSRGNH
jgi:hypothetical protein